MDMIAIPLSLDHQLSMIWHMISKWLAELSRRAVSLVPLLYSAFQLLATHS
jgi:hypothetical protein